MTDSANQGVPTPKKGFVLTAAAKETEAIDVPLVVDEEGNVVTGFKVLGSNSEAYQKAARRADLQNVKRATARGRPIDGRTDEGANQLLDTVERRELTIVLACIDEAYGFVDEQGNEHQPTTEELTELFTTLRPAWRKKLFTVIESEGNSLRG